MSLDGLRSAGELAQEFALVHAVLKSLSSIDEDDRNLVSELAAKSLVGIDVHFPPRKAASSLQFNEALFDDFAEMAPFSGVNHDLARQ